MILAFLLFLIAPDCGHPETWKHVYHPQRLVVADKAHPCITVTGTVKLIRKEADGDLHVQLELDPGPQSHLLNARNVKAQKNRLVVEPICVNTPKQADAIEPCKGFHQSFPALKLGAHVQVSGPFRTDTEAQHGWNEVHAPYEVKLIP
jgi:hypothetical protein